MSPGRQSPIKHAVRREDDRNDNQDDENYSDDSDDAVTTVRTLQPDGK
jgi:hypothetical protein